MALRSAWRRFRTIIWRKEKVTNLDEKVTEHGEKVSEQDGKSVRAEKKSDRVRLTAKQRKVLEFCDETPRTSISLHTTIKGITEGINPAA